jgi:hypothetical protein
MFPRLGDAASEAEGTRVDVRERRGSLQASQGRNLHRILHEAADDCSVCSGITTPNYARPQGPGFLDQTQEGIVQISNLCSINIWREPEPAGIFRMAQWL